MRLSHAIGVLAGMGPRSTAPFLERVLDECVRQYGAAVDADFPPIHIFSIPTPFILNQPLDHESMRTTLRKGLEILASVGPRVIGIPCNVAHLYLEDLVRDIPVPVLDLVAETVRRVPDGSNAVAVLGARQTVQSGLYQDALMHRGCRIDANPEIQRMSDALIGGVKAGWPRERLRGAWDRATADLVERGVDCVVLGSTDLAALPHLGHEPRLSVVDSSLALAAALVEYWRARDE